MRKLAATDSATENIPSWNFSKIRVKRQGKSLPHWQQCQWSRKGLRRSSYFIGETNEKQSFSFP